MHTLMTSVHMRSANECSSSGLTAVLHSLHIGLCVTAPVCDRVCVEPSLCQFKLWMYKHRLKLNTRHTWHNSLDNFSEFRRYSASCDVFQIKEVQWFHVNQHRHRDLDWQGWTVINDCFLYKRATRPDQGWMITALAHLQYRYYRVSTGMAAHLIVIQCYRQPIGFYYISQGDHFTLWIYRVSFF